MSLKNTVSSGFCIINLQFVLEVKHGLWERVTRLETACMRFLTLLLGVTLKGHYIIKKQGIGCKSET